MSEGGDGGAEESTITEQRKRVAPPELASNSLSPSAVTLEYEGGEPGQI